MQVLQASPIQWRHACPDAGSRHIRWCRSCKLPYQLWVQYIALLEHLWHLALLMQQTLFVSHARFVCPHYCACHNVTTLEQYCTADQEPEPLSRSHGGAVMSRRASSSPSKWCLLLLELICQQAATCLAMLATRSNMKAAVNKVYSCQICAGMLICCRPHHRFGAGINADVWCSMSDDCQIVNTIQRVFHTCPMVCSYRLLAAIHNQTIHIQGKDIIARVCVFVWRCMLL